MQISQAVGAIVFRLSPHIHVELKTGNAESRRQSASGLEFIGRDPVFTRQHRDRVRAGMKLFTCESCGQLLYFENFRCERCGHQLGYVPDAGTLSALEPANNGEWRSLAVPDRLYRFCANADYAACNWLVPAASRE